MPEDPRRRRPKMPTVSERASDRAGAPTVASLGVQARLVRVDPNRERDIADLVASCEILRIEWERLFRRVVDLLGEELRSNRGDRPPSSSEL
jgi:hypothetical protein